VLVLVRPLLLTAFVAAIAACNFTGGYETGYRCGEGDRCPEGQSCVGGVCVLGGDDDGSDASVPDADPTMPDGDVEVADRCGTIALLRDDFTDPSTGLQWFSWTDSSATTIGESNGQLAITMLTGSFSWAGYSSAYAYDLTGSAYEVAVPQAGGWDTVIEVRSPDDDKAQMIVENGDLIAVVLNTPDTDRQAMIDYVPSTHRHWRIREAGGQLYWEWSTDRVTWNELHQMAAPFPVDHVFGIVAAGEFAPGGPNTALFDDVNLPAQIANERYCAAETLRDEFASTPIDDQWESWADTGCSTTIASGALHLTFDGTNDAWCGIGSRHLFDLTESSLTIDAAGVGTSTGFIAYLQATAPRDDSTHVLIGREGPDLVVEQQLGANVPQSDAIPYDATAMRWWRLRGAADRIYFETSPDATDWTVRLDAPAQMDLSQVSVSIGGGRYAAGGSVAVDVAVLNP
jgi:hypothetical protein